MADGQMTLSTYLDLDGLPARVSPLEAAVAALPSTYQTLTAAAKQDAALAFLLDGKCKNLLDLSQVLSTTTASGITWTVDPDAGTIRAQCSGTVSSNTFLYIWNSNTDYPAAETHVLSGCPSGGGQSAYNLQTAIGSTVYRDTGGGIEVPAGTYRYVAIGVYSGQTNVDLTFQPMLCPKKIHDVAPDFVPYYPSLSEMWQAIKSLQSGTRSASVQETHGIEETQEEQR